MGVSVKADWINHYQAAQKRGQQEAERRTGARIQHWALLGIAAFLVGGAVLIYTLVWSAECTPHVIDDPASNSQEDAFSLPPL
jgi:hypothetical protein